jgi:hypothetical protein
VQNVFTNSKTEGSIELAAFGVATLELK